MIIAQISDSHIDPEHENADARMRELEACVAEINALDPLPDVVVHTGDMAHNGDREKYRHAMEHLDRLRCPFHAVTGNRDDRALLHEFFPPPRDLMPGAPFYQYVVEDFAVRLIILDTKSNHGNQGDFCAARAQSLCATLTEHPDRPTALFMHHPPFEVSESKYPQQFDPWEAVAVMTDTIKDQRQVIAAFCGHSHRDTGGMLAHIPVRSIPSIAVDLRLGEIAPEIGAAPVFKLHRYVEGKGFESETRACLKSAA